MLLTDDCWYKDEKFFTREPVKTEWKLVSKEFVPGSIGKDYIEQTKVLRDYLKSNGELSKEEAAECSDKTLVEIAELMKADWKEAAKRLTALKINKNHRRQPVEILYDWIVRFKNRQERGILEGKYDWSSALSSDGNIVIIGYAASAGAYVNGWLPGSANDDLGVCSSR